MLESLEWQSKLLPKVLYDFWYFGKTKKIKQWVQKESRWLYN
jgi:hypothetical protein